jgi:hypothetical protein
MMKNVIVALMFVCLVGCGSTEKMAISGAGSTDGDALMTVGRIVERAEVGITGVAFKQDNLDTSYAVGPYAVYLIPTPEDIAQDWQPFAGGAMLMTADGELDFIPKMVGGVIYKPQDALSPVLMVEKAFPTSSVDAPSIVGRGDDIYTWFGVRYRFK